LEHQHVAAAIRCLSDQVEVSLRSADLLQRIAALARMPAVWKISEGSWTTKLDVALGVG
jgi:hypothetical protein